MSKQSDLVSVSQGSGGDPLYIDTTNDRVGVGTTSPQKTLDVRGELAISNNTTSYWNLNRDDTDGSLTFTDTNVSERMRIDTSGRVTMPYQPAFYVRFTSGSHSSGTIPFNEVQVNVGSHYNTSTGRFTAPVAGKYAFFTQVASDRTTNTGDFGADIRKNGTIIIRTYFGKNSNNVHAQCSGSCVIDLAANDWVDVSQYGNAGVNLLANGNHTNFGGHLIG